MRFPIKVLGFTFACDDKTKTAQQQKYPVAPECLSEQRAQESPSNDCTTIWMGGGGESAFVVSSTGGSLLGKIREPLAFHQILFDLKATQPSGSRALCSEWAEVSCGVKVSVREGYSHSCCKGTLSRIQCQLHMLLKLQVQLNSCLNPSPALHINTCPLIIVIPQAGTVISFDSENSQQTLLRKDKLLVPMTGVNLAQDPPSRI